jgi:glycosyltransferase involved in cell wall biosynthesis
MQVTVIVASYKYGHLAGHCLDTIVSQSRKPEQILFVDDGIGDCNHLPKIYPEVKYTMRKENLGTVLNFQDMLSRVQTTHYMIVGADNWLRQDALAILTEKEADIISYDIAVVGEYAREFGKRVNAPKHHEFYNWSRKDKHHGSMIWNTEKAKEFGYTKVHNETTKTLEDQTLFDNMRNNGATYHHIPEPLLYYRRHRKNHNGV